MACLWAGSGSVRSQELPAGNTVRIQISEPNRALLPASSNARDAAYAKVRYLIEELVTQRSESARLSIELADANTKRAEIEAISRQQETLLTASTAALASRDRRDAAVRSEIADLRQRMEMAQSELQHKRVEIDRLAAALMAAYKAADEATSIARDNLAAIDAQVRAFRAAAGNPALAGAERPAELLSAEWVDVAPYVSRQ
jgi:chromosome segregation ATPase